MVSKWMKRVLFSSLEELVSDVWDIVSSRYGNKFDVRVLSSRGWYLPIRSRSTLRKAYIIKLDNNTFEVLTDVAPIGFKRRLSYLNINYMVNFRQEGHEITIQPGTYFLSIPSFKRNSDYNMASDLINWIYKQLEILGYNLNPMIYVPKRNFNEL